MVQLRAFRKQTHSNVPQQSLAAFGTADGLQWKFLSMVAAQDNVTLMQLDWEGPGENDLLRLRDGMLLAVFRVESCQSYWKATSTNGGEGWSHPVAVGFGSVRVSSLSGCSGSASSGFDTRLGWFLVPIRAVRKNAKNANHQILTRTRRFKTSR